MAIKGADWKEAKAFAKAVAMQLEEDEPDRYTTTVAKKARTGKIFVDYLRNDRTSTGVAPWSPRARDGAPIAVPLSWTQVKKGLDPNRFTLRSVPKLLARSKAWQGYNEAERPLLQVLKRIVGK